MTRMRPEPGKVVVVPEIPSCDFCEDGTPGPYDFKTKFRGGDGPWAHGCEDHWRLYRASPDLGVGTGQLWITEEQVAPDPIMDARPGTVGAMLRQKVERQRSA